MDLEDAAALRVCARVEKQRLEAQQECISLVAAARRCLALRRSVSRSGGGNTRCTVQGGESGHAVCTLDRRVRVEQYSASRGGVACHAGRGEGSASGGSFLCVSCAAALCASGKTGTLLGVAV